MMNATWGGPRAGAGRPKKAHAYRDSVRRADALAAASLPALIRMLVKRALEQDDVKAAIYLIDRICGRPTQVLTVPSEDVRQSPRSRSEVDDLLLHHLFSAIELRQNNGGWIQMIESPENPGRFSLPPQLQDLCESRKPFAHDGPMFGRILLLAVGDVH
jgi:hypothetical protein